MRYTFTAIFSAAIVLTGAAAYGAEPETRLLVRDLHRAERLIAAAVSAADQQELRQQRRALLGASSRIPRTEETVTSVNCGMAVSSLANLALDLSEVHQARKVISAEAEQRAYIGYVTECERKLDIKPPARPNLR
ncbi:hypothetical protein ACQVP2_18680 [Methylobacterium aquaticum]|uniref:hypothetical protein n=1 Tax=Methylobacterium aquaticum TaxID=270351 RepID=UPI003D17870E